MSDPKVFSGSDKNELINCLTKLAEHKENFYRGYSKQDELFPSIIRDKETDVEIKLLMEFEKYGAHYFTAANPVDFMSYAQHYGLPTRLLDFTTNPFVALYFAIFGQKGPNYKVDNDKDYYYIRCASRTDNLCFDELPISLQNMVFDEESVYTRISNPDDKHNTQKPVTGYSLWSKAWRIIYAIENADGNHGSQELNNGIREGKLLFIEPNQSNQRMIMQQGLFMLPYTLDQTKLLEIINKNTTEIRIHKALREPMTSYLDTIGINAFRLMPDLQNICAAVERKVKEHRGKSGDLRTKSDS